MKKSKYQQYFPGFIVCILVHICILVYLLLEYSNYSNKALIRREGLIRRRRLCQCGSPKLQRLLEGGADLRLGAY